MKTKIIAMLTLTLSQLIPASAQTNETTTDYKACYRQAKQGLEAMLSGKEKLSYEKAIFLVENASTGNKKCYIQFRSMVSYGVGNILAIMNHIKDAEQKKTPDNFFDALQQKSKQDQGYQPAAKANFAIYKYMTDTTTYTVPGTTGIRQHWPYRYATKDPLGSEDWSNTQVSNLLMKGQGNCYAFASLFRIYAERLGSGANICTAPSHVYIRHKDDNGIDFNVEVASRAFPGTGTLSTLTYTMQEAIRNGISLRELDLQQSVALCLVYLAKGYEHKTQPSADDEFMMECAALALRYDSLNLNAMLLKAELLEKRLMASGKTVAQLQAQADFKVYETLLDRLYRLGYREMPLSMKNTLVKGWTRDSVTYLAQKNYLEHASGNGQTRYASLSWGLFDEDIADKPVERYGQTLFSTKQHKITGFAKEQTLYNNYNFDPVVFAWNIDPLAHKYPQLSPYVFVANNPIIFVDPDGAEIKPSDAFKASPSYPVFKLLRANSVYKKYVAPFEKNQDINYSLDYGALILSYQTWSAATSSDYTKSTGTFTSAKTTINSDIKTPDGGSVPPPTTMSMVSTLIHEAMHAYLIHTGIVAQDDDAQHEYIATNLRKDIIAGLKEYAKGNNITNLTEQDYNDMSWYGLDKTEAFQKAFKTEQQRAAWRERAMKLEYIQTAQKKEEQAPQQKPTQKPGKK